MLLHNVELWWRPQRCSKPDLVTDMIKSLLRAIDCGLTTSILTDDRLESYWELYKNEWNITKVELKNGPDL